MVSEAENKVCLFLSHHNKQVKVTLEFPEKSDPKAERELTDNLKAIYLEKIKLSHDSLALALQSPSTKDKEENR